MAYRPFIDPVDPVILSEHSAADDTAKVTGVPAFSHHEEKYSQHRTDAIQAYIEQARVAARDPGLYQLIQDSESN